MHIKDLFSLNGQIALVTGGTGHLGFAMAEALSEAGATVIVASRNGDKCEKVSSMIWGATGNKCKGLELDVSSRQSVNQAFSRLANEFGAINVLVNNAAYGAINILPQMSDKEWYAGMEGTIGNVFRCTQEALPLFEKATEGNRAIINIASMYGMVSPDSRIYGDTGLDNPPNYGCGKAAVIQFTRYAACHLANRGIRVNTISPGPFPKKEIRENQWFISNLEEKVPLGRIGKPEEIKGAVLFLASRASSFITGHNLVVDGGWTAW